jgi:hypothetical protein
VRATSADACERGRLAGGQVTRLGRRSSSPTSAGEGRKASSLALLVLLPPQGVASALVAIRQLPPELSDSPRAKELALGVDDLVQFLAGPEEVFERDGAHRSGDDVDVLLLRPPTQLAKVILSLRAYPTQSANSLVLGTVAERRMMLTCSGNMMMTSSQTTPRWCQLQLYSRAYFSVVDVVHLVEDDELNVADQVGSLVEHAAQNLGRHLLLVLDEALVISRLNSFPPS